MGDWYIEKMNSERFLNVNAEQSKVKVDDGSEI
jgi:hypothetical protein